MGLDEELESMEEVGETDAEWTDQETELEDAEDDEDALFDADEEDAAESDLEHAYDSFITDNETDYDGWDPDEVPEAIQAEEDADILHSEGYHIEEEPEEESEVIEMEIEDGDVYAVIVDEHDNEIGFDAGLLNVVRLCSSLDLTLEARCLLVNQRFDGVTGGRTGEGMLSVTAGLAYKFNRRGFVRASNVQPVDVTPYLDRIRNLEENNTDLASKNSVLNDENEKLRNAPAKVVVEQKVSASPVVLFFRIGKATLDSKELTNLEFYVRNAMKLDSDKTFTLIGSADKDTGNRELNQRLSEQRMEYVYDLLKNKYGVAPERLVRKAEGDTNNRFAEPELNRAVIVE